MKVRGGDAKSGVVRIKVDEETANYLERATMSRSQDGYLRTGRQAFDDVLIACKANTMTRVFKPLNNEYEEKHRRHGLHLWYEVKFDKTSDVNQTLDQFEGMKEVAISEPVYEKLNIGYSNPAEKFIEVTLSGAPNDPLFADQWHYNNTGQTGGTVDADIDALEAWGIETGNSQVIVAVTDGGIDVLHEDLASNMWVNVDEIPGNGIDDDNNGFIDDVNGYGFGDDSGTIPADQHGTHVGGTVAAVTNNGIGVSGVAGGDGSGDGVRLMSLAAFGQFSTGNFEGTYVYAADNGAVISQNSWGYTSPGVFEQVVLDAIDYFIAEAGFDGVGNPVGPMHGGLVIFAAGNDGSFSDFYPGFYDPVLAVGGTDHNDDEYIFSNRGDWVDVAAPGVSVLSCLPNDSYGIFTGTSMACPHVSGVAGLIVSRNLGSITPDQVRFLITETADPLPGLEFLGSGRVNAFAALQFNDGAPPDDITDLAVTDQGLTSVTLQWTAPADAGSANASTYDIRYSTSIIDSANFDAANSVANPPVASPAGTVESFAVSGLDPATEYFFAIKSADFFGNVSGISNVVNATTNDIPIAEITPTSLTSDLITGASEVQQLSISNPGLGPLDFDIAFANAGFLTSGVLSGTVPAGGSQGVDITFDASGLFGGTYLDSVIVNTNDPSNPVFVIPATLNVTGTGTPVVGISPDSLLFSTLFVGASETMTFSISNEGTEILNITDINVTSVDFNVLSDTSYSILPFESQEISIEFSPTQLGDLSAQVIVENNDVQQVVSVFGEGVEPPEIEINPGSLSADLVSGDTENAILTITNNGVADLTFELEITEPGATTTSVSTEFAEITVRQASSENVKQSLASQFAGMQILSEVSLLAGTIEVLLLTPDDDISDLESALSAFSDLNVTRFPETSLPSITLTDVEGYDIIVTTNNTQWLSGGNVSPVLVGDVLADFIDQGGKVIANCFAYDYDAWALEGRFIDDNYGPFSGTSTDFTGSVNLGTVLEPAHPIMNGVSAISNSYLWQNPILAPGATLIADWSDGSHFLAVNDNVVALNILPSDGGGAPGWTGDLATLYHNAIAWLSGPTFVSVDIESDTLATGESVDINVSISAAGLNAGLFEADINVNSNDPANSSIAVPVTLTVLGPPVEALPSSFSVILEEDQSVTETLTLKNNSQTDATYDISIQNVTTSGISVSLSPVPLVARTEAFSGTPIPQSSFSAITSMSTTQYATTQYATGFEDFAPGDIDGQQGWAGQFGNWAIGTSNPSEGNQSIESLSDGLGQTLAFSPTVPVGTEPFSSVSAMVEVQGSGVTWELIPQSNTAGLVNTRLRFNANGSIDVLVSDGVGGSAFELLPITTPTGYFKVGIEVDRATSEFTIFIDDQEVYNALGFAGDIEQLVLLSAMEVFGPTFFIDELQIIDGEVEVGIPFLSVDPASGVIPSGSSIDLDVTFSSTDQSFGTQTANIVVEVNDGDQESVIVPAMLTVIGDPAIAVDPTVVIETVDYDKPSTRIVTIENTGGSPLNYDLTVFGAETTTSAEELVGQLGSTKFDERIITKLEEDNMLSTKTRINEPPKTQFITVGTPIFTEDFEGGTFPPSGWTTVDNEGSGVVWDFAASYGDGNYSGSGEAATVNSDAFGPAEFDTELITPAINIAGKSDLALKYNVNYQNLAFLDFLDVDISIDGGTNWITLLSWNEDHGAFFAAPGEAVSIPLDSIVDGASEMMIRWHYYDPNSGDWDWYAQIDDVEVVENSEVWLAVNNAAGTVEVGEVAEVELQFDPTVVDPGLYVAGIIVNSNASNTPVVGVVVAMDELNPAIISPNATVFEEELVAGRKDSQILTISNPGESALDFAFEDNFPNIGDAPSDSTMSTSIVGKTKADDVDLTSKNAFGVDDIYETFNAVELPVNFSSVLYATNFEEFSAGDINGQQGWVGQFSNWQIDSSNPAGGIQHIRSISDGLGFTLAFTPEVPVGIESISSTSMMVDMDGTGVTWQIIPQSIVQDSVVTRLSFDPDGTASVLVGAGFEPITASVPDGPFEVKIEVEKISENFTIYFDDVPVFNGVGFAGSIEQVVLLSLMEVSDPTFDIDNLQIVDGVVPELPVSVEPSAGTIASGEFLDVTIAYDATNLLGGAHEETLVVNSNDPENSQLEIETILTVIDPQIISINPDSIEIEVAYQQEGTTVMTVTNVGVADLIFHIDVGDELTIPGSTTENELATSKNWQQDTDIVTKLTQDDPIVAPSYSSLVEKQGLVAVVNEGFEGETFPPVGWTVVDNAGTGVQWSFANDWGDGNYTGGSGEAATVNSDAAGTVEFDTELRSPSMDVNGQTGLTLQYDANYQNLAGLDFLDTDISTDGGATWTTMVSWNEDHGGFFSEPGEVVNIDLDPYLVGATSFIVRWHYYDPNTGDWDWYAQIDNVVIGVPWLSISQAADTLGEGESVDILVSFDASLLESGNYFSNLQVCSNDLRNPQVDVPVELYVQTPPAISFNPEEIELILQKGDKKEVELTISNTGESPLDYNLLSLPDYVRIIEDDDDDNYHRGEQNFQTGGDFGSGYGSGYGHGHSHNHGTDELSGTLTGGDSRLVTLRVKAKRRGMDPGYYFDSLVFETNDPELVSASVEIGLTVAEKVNFYVAPNPFRNTLFIIMGRGEPMNHQVYIYDLHGNLKYEGEVESKSYRPNTLYINTRSFDRGIHELIIISENGVVNTRNIYRK